MNNEHGTDKSFEQKAVARYIVEKITDPERVLLESWAKSLLIVAQSDVAATTKAKRAISITREHEVLIPVMKMLGSEIKRRAWDNRGTAGRFGIAGAAIGLTLFGGQGAGIAAFGTAVGVPLWIVLGSGAAFAGALIDELSSRPHEPTVTYTVLDAKKVDDQTFNQKNRTPP